VLAAIVYLRVSFFCSSSFNGRETRSARRQLAAQWMMRPVRPARRNVHGSLLLGKLPKSMTSFREGLAVSSAGVVSRAVADLDATSANGLLTRKSPGRLGRA